MNEEDKIIAILQDRIAFLKEENAALRGGNQSTPDKASLKKRYEAAGQSQVFKFLDEGKLSAEQEAQLLKQLAGFDLDRIASLHKDAMAFDAEGQANLGKLEPPDSYDAIQEATDETKAEWERAGFDAMKAGECAALVLAGGAGTRLGFAFPKGMYDLNLPSKKSLFQLYAERLVKVASLAGSKPLPWYIMTSEGDNHKHTTEFFAKHNFFGYGEENIKFFSQGVLPCMTVEGKMMLETGFKVGEAADGNGGIYGALQNTGQVEDMKARGVKYVHCFSVDNAIGKVADPLFMGYCISRGANVGNKVVWKAEPGEKVGIFGKRNGRSAVIEYSEMTKEDCELTDANGKLVYGAGNICNHFYTVDFLGNVKDSDLIFHVARKKIKSPSEDGQTAITPEENTGIKLECFIFDCFGMADTMAILEGPREEEFSPVKNPVGNPKDSPDSARAMLTAQNINWLEKAGFTVVKGDGQCELSPFASYRGEGLEKLKEKLGDATIDLSKGDFQDGLTASL